MNKPILFIETPRAGKHNHRFITPTDYKDSDSLLSQFADIARKQAETTEAKDDIIISKGIHFLATGKKASQTSGGRIGWEQLILVNVEVKRLSPEQIANINSFLQQHLKEVERLITETIDWNKIDTIMVPREELNQWLQELEQRLGIAIPAMPQKFKPQIKTTSESKRRWYMELVIGSVIISGFSIWIAMNNLDKNDPRWQIIEKWTNIKIGVPKPNDQEQSAKAELDAAKKQGERLIAAIAGNREDVKKELTPFALPDANAKIVSDTWKINLGDKIKDSGPWLVSIFFQKVDGNAITTGLWGKNIDQLQIADTAGSLQPLVQCRTAIRNLMEVTEADKVYTPFFQNEDFNEVSNPLGAVNDKIYAWTDRAHPDAVKSRQECDTKPKDSENLLSWIEKCVIPIEGGFVKDKDLQRIKKMGKDCSEVQFISPTVPDTGTIKK